MVLYFYIIVMFHLHGVYKTEAITAGSDATILSVDESGNLTGQAEEDASDDDETDEQDTEEFTFSDDPIRRSH